MWACDAKLWSSLLVPKEEAHEKATSDTNFINTKFFSFLLFAPRLSAYLFFLSVFTLSERRQSQCLLTNQRRRLFALIGRRSFHYSLSHSLSFFLFFSICALPLFQYLEKQNWIENHITHTTQAERWLEVHVRTWVSYETRSCRMNEWYCQWHWHLW
jgi:hypothetical protein